MSEERAILVGAGERRHMAELGRLASTLGIEVSGELEQVREPPRRCQHHSPGDLPCSGHFEVELLCRLTPGAATGFGDG